MEKVYFTADTHFGHKNILTLCKRKFSDIEEHDEFIIESFNSVVTNSDRLYILGDLGHKDEIDKLRDKLKRINGQKHIILGNHDNLNNLVQLKREKVIADVKESKTVNINGKKVFLSHFPLREWPGYFSKAYSFYGHCHNNIDDFELSTDVGIDSKGYNPLSFEQLEDYLLNQNRPSRIEKTDGMINEFFPNLSTNYFVGLCTGNKEIRDKITEVLLSGGKGIGLTK